MTSPDPIIRQTLTVHTRVRGRRWALGAPVTVVVLAESADPDAITRLQRRLPGSITDLAQNTQRGPGFGGRLERQLRSGLEEEFGRYSVPGVQVSVQRVESAFDSTANRNQRWPIDYGYYTIRELPLGAIQAGLRTPGGP